MLNQIKEILRGRMQLIALGLIGTVILALALAPSTPDFARLEELTQMGNYQAARIGLEQALARNPDWHEARALLAEAELGDDRLDQALAHLLVLARQGRDTRSLESKFNRWLRQGNAVDTDSSAQALEMIMADKTFLEWEWLTNFGLNLAFICLDKTAQYLLFLGENQLFSAWDTVQAGLSRLLDRGEWETLWQVAAACEGFATESWLHGNFFISRGELIHVLKPEVWPDLQNRFPQDALAAIGYALSLPPGEGLAWLRQWEGQNPLPQPIETYSQLKSILLLESPGVKPEDLIFVTGAGLVTAAIEARHQTNQVLPGMIAARWEELGGDPGLAAAIGLVPQPIYQETAASFWDIELSPDGKHLIFGPSATWEQLIINLDSKEQTAIPYYPAKWSPDSTRLYIGAEGGISVFSAQGKLLQNYDLGFAYFPVGWRDEKSIWLTSDNFGKLHVLSLSGGQIEPVIEAKDLHLGGDPYAEFFPGPQGRIAWQSGGTVGVWDGQKIATYRFSGWLNGISWYPDGSGLILELGEGLYSQPLRGQAKPVSLPQSIRGARFMGWRNSHEMYLSVPLEDTLHRQLMIYNEITGDVTLTEYFNPHKIAGQRVLVSYFTSGFPRNQGKTRLLVYDLP